MAKLVHEFRKDREDFVDALTFLSGEQEELASVALEEQAALFAPGGRAQKRDREAYEAECASV